MWFLHDCWQIRWITNNNDVRPLHKDTLDRAAEAGADRPVTGTQVARLATRHVTVKTRIIRFYSVNVHAHEPRKATAPASGF